MDSFIEEWKPVGALEWSSVDENWPEATVMWDIDGGPEWMEGMHGPWPMRSWNHDDVLLVVASTKSYYTCAVFNDGRWHFLDKDRNVGIHTIMCSKLSEILAMPMWERNSDVT